jgi:hypothetical protein
MCNCTSRVWLRTEHESENWTPLPRNSIYGNYSLWKFEQKRLDIAYSAHTWEPGKNCWLDIRVWRWDRTHYIHMITNVQFELCTLVYKCQFCISEVLADFTFKLFFLDSHEDRNSEHLQMFYQSAWRHIPENICFHERRSRTLNLADLI